MSNEHFDVFILGAGPGGYACALKLAKLGKKTAIAEKAYYGGTCTNVGCIPTKAVLSAAALYESFDNAKRFGIILDKSAYSANINSIYKHMDRCVLASRKGVELLLKNAGVAMFAGEAEISGQHSVTINNQIIEADSIIIATGSTPIVFDQFNIPDILNSDNVWSITEFPKSIVIIGGGVIGVEMATFFSTFGVPATLIEILPQLISMEDEDIALSLEESLKKSSVKVLKSTKVIKIDKTAEGYTVTYENDKGSSQIQSSDVFLSLGRKPVLPKIASSLSITPDKKGFVTINDAFQTSVPSIYAIGDVTGKLMLAHTAMYQGEICAEIIAGHTGHLDYTTVPNVIFTHPEIASVGLKEKDCKAQGIDYLVGTFPVSASGKAKAIGKSQGFVKVIADKKSHVILGLAMICPNATDMIMEGVLMVKNKLTVENIMHTVHPHPTLTEMMAEAAADTLKMSLHK